MKSFAKKVLNLLPANLEYADCRVVETKQKKISTKDGVVEELQLGLDYGFGVRVLVKGAWGFAGSSSLTQGEARKTVSMAVKLAQAASLTQPKKVKLSHVPVVKDSYRTPVKIDPFKVPTSKIVNLLLAADKAQRIGKKIKISQTYFSAFRQKKIFASTEGSLINQEIVFTGAGLEATAVEKGEVQNRSYPKSAGGQFETRGWEMVEEVDLKENASRIANEALKLLHAPNCPQGEFDLIITNCQLALQVHESCGHPIELDRVLGFEASYAGTSFLTSEKLKNYQYGSKVVNITADATIPGGLGTFGYDDEGVAAKKVEIIKNGRFVGYLTSRETAWQYDLPVTGAMRAAAWSHLPLIRMTNINLLPGKWNLDDLIADTKKGLLLSTNRSWSIDDKRLNFQFGTEIAWEIKNGKLGKIYKNPVYSDMTPRFWQSCDAVCNKKYWRVWGTPNCGKGQPGQAMYVGHGVSPARFRKVKVFPGRN